MNGDGDYHKEISAHASRILELLRQGGHTRDRNAIASLPPPPVGTYNGQPPGAASRLAAARSWQRVQRLRSNHLNGVLFVDPAWDILLELYIARHENRLVTVSNAALATTVPASTALRWLGSLVEDGWLERQNDRTDHRRINVSMPEATFERMNHLLDEVMDSDRKLGLARIHLIE